MPLPITIPNTFANATATIPLSQLDSNFSTVAVAVNSIGNGAFSLANVQVTGGTIANVTLDNVSVDVETLSNVTITNLTVNGNATFTNAAVTANVATITTANVTTANIATAEIANVTVSGVATFAAGSNTAPTLTTSGDTNTGVFFPAADTVAIGTGGSERMRIDTSGYILGGYSSAFDLSPAGTGQYAGISASTSSASNWKFGALSFSADATANGMLFLKSRSATVGTNTVVQSGDALGNIGWRGADGTNYINAAGIQAFVDGTPGTNDMPGRLVFLTTADGSSTAVERMRIDSSGNLGLGGTPKPYLNPNYNAFDMHSGRTVLMSSSGTPQTNLQTNAYYDSTDSRFEYSQTGYAASLYQQQSGVHSWYTAPSGTAGNAITFTQAMTLDASGRLLVGTTSSSWDTYGSFSEFRKDQNSRSLVTISNQNTGSSGAAGILFAAYGNSWVQAIGTSANNSNALTWSLDATSPSEKMRITSGGHFCVGTTTAANTAFQATFNGASNGGINLQNNTNYSSVSVSGDDFYVDVGRGGTAGSFNVRTSSNTDARFQISGAGVMTCAGVYNNTVGATNRDVFVDNTGKIGYVASIRASKTNIQDLTDTSWLHQLNPVSFNYRKKDEEGNYTDETDGDIQYGMIAEDVEQVRPDLCFYDEVDGEQELRGIQYSKLVPVMLKEIQKLRAELDALKGTA